MLIINLSLFLLIINSFIITQIGLSEIILPLIVYLINFLYLVKGKIPRKGFYFFLGTIALSLISKSPNLIWFFFMGRIIEKKSLRKIIINIEIVYALAALVIFICGIFEDNLYMNFNRNGEYIKRYHLGFGNPNTLALYALTMITMWYVFIVKRFNIKNQIIYICITFFIYFFTYSRNTLLLLIICYFFILLRKKIVRYSILEIIPYILMAASLMLSTIYSHNKILNKILTNRPLIWGKWINGDINGYKIQIFGLGNQVGGSKINYPLDNGYIYILLTSGILFCFILLIIFNIVIKRIYKAGKSRDLIYILIFLFLNIAETVFLRFIFVPIISIILYEYLVINKKQKS